MITKKVAIKKVVTKNVNKYNDNEDFILLDLILKLTFLINWDHFSDTIALSGSGGR